MVWPRGNCPQLYNWLRNWSGGQSVKTGKLSPTIFDFDE